MATFGIFNYGGSVYQWADPARAASPGDPGAPSRLNPIGTNQQNAIWVASGGSISLASGDLSSASPPSYYPGIGWQHLAYDSTLGGRLYTWWAVESPGMSSGAQPPMLTPIPGLSCRCEVMPYLAGHYAIGCQRDGDGTAVFHFDAR